MAIVTNPIKKQVIDNLRLDIDSDANEYVIAIGRSEDWKTLNVDGDLVDVPPVAVNTLREERNFRQGIQSVKNVVDFTFVVPRYNWASGAIYSAYDDAQVGYPTQTYYVMNDNNQVYMCIQRGTNSSGQAQVSTVQPTGGTDGTPFDTADGYVWKFLYSIGALDASKYISANYLPIQLVRSVDDNSPAADVEQLAVQNNSVAGQIVGYAIDSGGEGYGQSAPSITISGNGTGAAAAAQVQGGQVTRVTLVDNSGVLALGSGYDYATVAVGGNPTKPAKVRAIFAPKNGLGADPRDDLRSTAIMFNVKPDGAEGDLIGANRGDFIVGNDFRQVGLLRNVYDSDGTGGAGVKNIFTGSTGNGLKKLMFNGASNTGYGFTADNIFKGAQSESMAYIDRVDSDGLMYHQTEETGFGVFQSETIAEIAGSTSSGTATTDPNQLPFKKPEIDTLSGDLLYIDNRGSITRSDGQTEDIKIVIQI